ncbi:MAG: hypothetical protein D4R81_04585 [Nitrospiraceae bacterium]|nr:MAG: hypothetical protein D4R81_04585 [Nitrospiraceae bacterium]
MSDRFAAEKTYRARVIAERALLAQQQIGTDLRQHSRLRIPIPFSCSFSPINVPPWWEGSSNGLGVVFDISLNGLKFMGETLPPPGEQLTLMVRLPHQQSPLQVDVATVRWRVSQTIGLEFTTLSESAAKRLREFLPPTSPEMPYLDPTKPECSVKSLGSRDTIPEQVQPEHNIEKAQEDLVVLQGERGKKSVPLETAPKKSAIEVRQPIYRSHVSLLVLWGMPLIALFVLYQAWWEPSDRPTPQQPTQPTDSAALLTPQIPGQITRGEGARVDISQPRLIDFGQAPSTPVNAIRAEPEEKRDVQVEAGLRKLSKKSPAKTDPDLRSSSQVQPAKVPLPARQGLQPVVGADLFLVSSRNKMGAAPPAEIGPSQPSAPVPGLSSVKTTLTPAAKPNPQPRPRNTPHFSVRFDGTADRETWMRMQAILGYAYQEICQKFGYVPDTPIKVVLHMKQKFSEEMGTPAWADTLFDHASGTIHIPAGQALDDLAWFSRVVRHEFVHALLHARMNTQLTVTPTWLVEGLALQLAEDPWSDLDEMRKKHPPFIPLASLQGRWNEIPADSLPMAYVEADLATRILTERYGIYRIQQVLNVVRTGQSLDAAMQAKLSLSYDRFQQQWAKALKVNLQREMS